MTTKQVLSPVSKLALHMAAKPGRYAVLAGSGLSFSAGIKTGRDITRELILKLATVEGQHKQAADDLEGWFATRFGENATYAAVVKMLGGREQTERDLLEPFFTRSPSPGGEQEAIEPTAAHVAIAGLVARGLVRVIVTTNFDDLFEQALDAESVSYSVVTANEAASAPPYSSEQCLVLKPHGDWRRGHIRNSPEDVATLSRPTERLLGRVFEDHALIICGWSAGDEAIRRRLTRRVCRRLPSFWITRGELQDEARHLCDHLDADVITGDAQVALPEIVTRVDAVRTFAVADPIEPAAIVARARRLISAGDSPGLDDLVDRTTGATCEWLDSYAWPAEGPLEHEAFVQLLAACEANTEGLARLALTMGRYDDGEAGDCMGAATAKLMESALARRTAREYGFVAEYAALLTAFAFGVAFAKRGRWQAAGRALRTASSGGVQRDRSVLDFDHTEFDRRLCPGTGCTEAGRLSVRIREWLRPLVADWIPRKIGYRRDFERFELLLSMLGEAHRNPKPWVSACMVPPFEGPPPEPESNDWCKPIGQHFGRFLAFAAVWAKDEHTRRQNQIAKRRGQTSTEPDPPPRATSGRELALAIDSNVPGNVEARMLNLWKRCDNVVSSPTPLEGGWLREAEEAP